MYDLGRYIPRHSLVHRTNPQVKLIAVIALSIMILQVHDPGWLLPGISSAVLGLIFLARLPLRDVLHSFKPAVPFFLLLFLLYVFFTPGKALPLFQVGPLQISHEGLSLGMIQIWKFLLLLAAAALLTMTTTQSELTGGLERLLRPLKIIGVSSHDLATLLGLALRFIPTLQDEMRNVKDAQLARGADFNTRRLGGKVKALVYLSMPLLLNVMRRSDELVDAMEARGYHPGPRTYLYENGLKGGDYAAIALTVVLTVVIVCYT